MDSYYTKKNLCKAQFAFAKAAIRVILLIAFTLFLNFNSLYGQCTELPVGWENVVLNEVTGDGGNIDSRNDAIVELAGPPGTDIGGWVVTNGEWAVVLPAGTVIPADGVFLIGCEIGADGPVGIGSYAGIENGLSCSECDFPGMQTDFDVCDTANAAYVSTSIYTSYGFTLDNGFCGANTDGDQVLLFRPDGTPHDGIYWGGNDVTPSGLTTFGGSSGSCGSAGDHISVQDGSTYTLGDNDNNGIINDYTGSHIGRRADSLDATAVNIMPSGNTGADTIAFTMPSITDPIWIYGGLSQVSCNSTHMRIQGSSSEQVIKAFTNSSHMDDPDLNDAWQAYASSALVPSSCNSDGAISQWGISTHPNPGEPNDVDSWDYLVVIGTDTIEINDATKFDTIFCTGATVNFLGRVFNYQHVESTASTTNKAGSFIEKPNGSFDAWTTVDTIGNGVTELASNSYVVPSVSGNYTYNLIWDDYTDCCGSASQSTVANSSNPHECYEKVCLTFTVPIPLLISADSIICPDDLFPGLVNVGPFINGGMNNSFILVVDGIATDTNLTGIFTLPTGLSTTSIDVVAIDGTGCSPNDTVHISQACEAPPVCPSSLVNTGSTADGTYCVDSFFDICLDGIDLPAGGSIDFYADTISSFDPNTQGTLLGSVTIPQPLPAPIPSGGPVLNEILVNPEFHDGSGGAYIEIAGAPGTDLSCYVVTDGEFTIVIPNGETIPADGFYLMGVAGLTPPNDIQDSLIDLDVGSCGCTGGTGGSAIELLNSGEFVGLFDPSLTIVDGLIWIEDDNNSNDGPNGQIHAPVYSLASCPDSGIFIIPDLPDVDMPPSPWNWINTDGPNGLSLERDLDVTGSWQVASELTPGASNPAITVPPPPCLNAQMPPILCTSPSAQVFVKGLIQPQNPLCNTSDYIGPTSTFTLLCPSAEIDAVDIELCELSLVSSSPIVAITTTGTGPWDVYVSLDDGTTSTKDTLTIAASPFNITYSQLTTAFGANTFTDLSIVIDSVVDLGTGCVGTFTNDIAVIDVLPAPTLNILSSQDLTACDGTGPGSVQIQILPSNSGPWLFEYSINGGAPITASSFTSPFTLPIPTQGFVEILSVSSEAGCIGALGTTTATINPPIAVSTNPTTPDTICALEIIDLSLVPIAGSPAGGTINWYPTDPTLLIAPIRALIELTGLDLLVSPAATQTYYYTYTEGVSGCEDVGILIINVLPNPGLTAASNSPVCEENSLLLSESGGQAVTWMWSGPNSFSSSAQNPSIAAANMINGGDYTVTVTDINGCTSSQTTTVVVGTRANAGFNASNSVCTSAPSSSSVDIEALLSGADTGGTWNENTSSGADISNPASVDFTAVAAGVYTFNYVVTGTDGCPNDVAVFTVTINNTDCGTFPWTGME